MGRPGRSGAQLPIMAISDVLHHLSPQEYIYTGVRLPPGQEYRSTTRAAGAGVQEYGCCLGRSIGVRLLPEQEYRSTEDQEYGSTDAGTPRTGPHTGHRCSACSARFLGCLGCTWEYDCTPFPPSWAFFCRDGPWVWPERDVSCCRGHSGEHEDVADEFRQSHPFSHTKLSSLFPATHWAACTRGASPAEASCRASSAEAASQLRRG